MKVTSCCVCLGIALGANLETSREPAGGYRARTIRLSQSLLLGLDTPWLWVFGFQPLALRRR